MFTWHPDGRPVVWFDKIFQACQGPTSFIAYEYERGWVIFEYSHVFRSGGSLMFKNQLIPPITCFIME
jgi:hypothetical protein